MTSPLCWALCSACSPCDALGAGNPEASPLGELALTHPGRRLGCCDLLPLRPSSTDPAVVGVADAVVNEMMAPRCDAYRDAGGDYPWCQVRVLTQKQAATFIFEVYTVGLVASLDNLLTPPVTCPGGTCPESLVGYCFTAAPAPRPQRRPRCLNRPCRACRPRGWRRHRKGRYNRPIRALPWACSS